MIRYLLISGLFLLTHQMFGQSSVLIQDATRQKIIRYKIKGSWNVYDGQQFLDADGQYFGKCMTLEIRSKVDSTIIITVMNGLMLMCEDTTTQDMIITKPLYVELSPRESKTVQLYAMCSEIHDGMPHSLTSYSVGTMADDKLVAITNTIDKMFMHNIVGQGAVWAYTDNATEKDIRKYGATDASIAMTIQILNQAGVSTQLNPPSITKSDSTKVPTDADKLVEKAAPVPDNNVISVNTYIVYTASGSILLLLGSTIFLLIKTYKNRNDKQELS